MNNLQDDLYMFCTQLVHQELLETWTLCGRQWQRSCSDHGWNDLQLPRSDLGQRSQGNIRQRRPLSNIGQVSIQVLMNVWTHLDKQHNIITSDLITAAIIIKCDWKVRIELKFTLGWGGKYKSDPHKFGTIRKVLKKWKQCCLIYFTIKNSGKVMRFKDLESFLKVWGGY